MDRKKYRTGLILTAIGVFVAIMTIVFFWGRISFRNKSNETLRHASELKVLEFSASLSEQLTLVRQMIKSPSIASFMENPSDEVVQGMAMQEFSAFQNSFLSKSLFWVSDADHKFWQDMEMKYLLDPEDPATYWYKMTMYETEEYNFNINYNPDLDTTMLWVNAVIRNKA